MALLEIQSLSISLPVSDGMVEVVSGVELAIEPGEAVGLVGESGSGKSMTARAVNRLLPSGAEVNGEIRFNGTSVQAMDRAALRELRTRNVASINQNPQAALNPVRKVGDFVTEALVTNLDTDRSRAKEMAGALLADVGISAPERVMDQYPHELSGGMLQRCAIAAALITKPKLIIADEPTTALDVTTQSEVMAIINELRRSSEVALLFISHDLDLAAAVCDRTAVMYAGRVVESQPSGTLHSSPRHPYTAALGESRPNLDGARGARLAAIKGRPASAFEVPSGCPFAPRCTYSEERCLAADPPLVEVDGGQTACVRHEELASVLAGGRDDA